MADNITIKDAAGSNVVVASSETGGVHTLKRLNQPFDAVKETGLTELIGVNEQVDQNEYGGSVGIALGGTYSGEFLAATLISTGGAILKPDGKLILLDADPAVSVGDAALAASEWGTVIGVIPVATADWVSDANGAVLFTALSIPFHSLATIYAVYLHQSATSFNDAGGDDEKLEINLWYRRDS